MDAHEATALVFGERSFSAALPVGCLGNCCPGIARAQLHASGTCGGGESCDGSISFAATLTTAFSAGCGAGACGQHSRWSRDRIALCTMAMAAKASISVYHSSADSAHHCSRAFDHHVGGTGPSFDCAGDVYHLPRADHREYDAGTDQRGCESDRSFFDAQGFGGTGSV